MIERVQTSWPEQLVASPRTHQRFVRESLNEELELHHRERMPQHFTQQAASRYGHMKRNPNWIRYKLRRWKTGIDLVASGKSKAKILGPERRIVVSGSGETIRGRLEMEMAGERGSGVTGRMLDDADLARLARTLARGTDRDGRPLSPRAVEWIRGKLANRDGGNRRGVAGVTRAQQIKELRTVAADEARDVVAGLQSRYVGKIKAMKRRRLLSGVTVD